MDHVKIVKYDKKYKKDFELLNREWLEKYFKVEPVDEKYFENPEELILKPGGFIFFALLNNEPVGTCALLKLDNKRYELAKMGVKASAQGHGIGAKLIKYCFDVAKNENANEIELVSNRKLKPALHLYSKLGFKESDIDPEYLEKYERCDIKMIKKL